MPDYDGCAPKILARCTDVATRLPGFYEAPLICVSCGFGAVRAAGLAKNVGDVFCRCARCDHEVVGYLLVGASGGEEAEDFDFSLSEAIGIGRSGGGS